MVLDSLTGSVRASLPAAIQAAACAGRRGGRDGGGGDKLAAFNDPQNRCLLPDLR